MMVQSLKCLPSKHEDLSSIHLFKSLSQWPGEADKSLAFTGQPTLPNWWAQKTRLWYIWNNKGCLLAYMHAHAHAYACLYIWVLYILSRGDLNLSHSKHLCVLQALTHGRGLIQVSSFEVSSHDHRTLWQKVDFAEWDEEESRRLVPWSCIFSVTLLWASFICSGLVTSIWSTKRRSEQFFLNSSAPGPSLSSTPANTVKPSLSRCLAKPWPKPESAPARVETTGWAQTNAVGKIASCGSHGVYDGLFSLKRGSLGKFLLAVRK